MEKKTVLSCIQPTGSMHLGNYFGATQNWVKLQNEYQCKFGVVDYHAQTMPYKPKELSNHTLNMAIELLAIGIKPENLFIQSLIPEHTELAWILSNFTSFYDLLTQAQFKDKAGFSRGEEVDEDGNNVLRYNPKGFTSQGLFHYPVLQAADILIYSAQLVPVGKDQEKHLELARKIAKRFNKECGVELFKSPKALFTDIPKVQSLADPTSKMSKSGGEKNFIGIFESKEAIFAKVKAAVTDGEFDEDSKLPVGVENLLTLLKATGKTDEHDELRAKALTNQLRYVELKDILAASIDEMVAPFRERKQILMSDQSAVKDHIIAHSSEIRQEAKEMLDIAKRHAGLM